MILGAGEAVFLIQPKQTHARRLHALRVTKALTPMASRIS